MYNPNQPRVPAGDHHGGRWTSTGLGGGSAQGPQIASSAAMSFAPETLAVFNTYLAPGVRAALARIAATALGPLTVLGAALLVPTNRSLISEGTLSDNPDIRYSYDAGTGYLTLWHDVPGNSKPLLFHGRVDEGGQFRLPDGAVIGLDLGDGVLLSEEISEKEKLRRAASRAAAIAKALQRATELEVNDEPEICPAPTMAKPNNRINTWKVYQEAVTGISHAMEVVLNTVSFDGCEDLPGRIELKEAKGPGYAKHLRGDELPVWYSGKVALAIQLKKQSLAAGRNKVKWHVAEEAMVPYIRGLAQDLRCHNIDVVYTPYMPVTP